jgi:hypothetical protein
MVAASVRLRGIHPPDIIQNGGRPGGNASQTRTGQWHWLGPWRQHFDDESWRGRGYSSQRVETYRDVTSVPTFFVRMLGKLLDACI